MDEILVYIGRDRSQTAEKIAKRIRGKCELLAVEPLLGELRPELGAEYRVSTVDR